jgi:predicted esterase
MDILTRNLSLLIATVLTLIIAFSFSLTSAAHTANAQGFFFNHPQAVKKAQKKCNIKFNQRKFKKINKRKKASLKKQCIKRTYRQLKAQAKKAALLIGPSGTKFYYPPANRVNNLRPGKLIWSRPAGLGVVLSDASRTRLIAYTSKTPQGKTVAVSGSISLPKGKAPASGWPVISYGHGTTGIADQCAPSRNYPGGPVDPLVSYVNPEQNAWLKQGYAVLRTDYQGLGTEGVHSFLIGTAEGRSMIDIVRATKQLYPRIISKNYILSGHSQGGHSALFAAGLADSWAPGFKLKGTVSYAPASHLKEQVGLLPALTDPSGLSALAGLIVRGAETQNSGIVPSSLLNPPAFNLYPNTLTQCLGELSSPASLGGLAPSTLLNNSANNTALLNVLEENNPAVKTNAPVLLLQGTFDTTVFPFLTDSLDGELKSLGNNVDYRTYPGVNHSGIVSAAQPVVASWMNSKLPAR